MKDYKLECAELKGRIKELERELGNEVNRRISRELKDNNLRDRFKELLCEVLGS